MNFKAVFYILGTLLIVLGVCMLFSLGWSLYYGEDDVQALLISIGITLACGFLLRAFTSLKGTLGIRDGFLVVTLGWILAGVFGALPFVFYGAVDHFIDGFFETISGFTTTGATIITDVEILPHGILFWRSFTHWLGGMGIIVLFLALLPKIGAGAMNLFKAEVPGPVAEKVSPRITQTAKMLWFIYLGVSLLQTILLMLTGFNLFDALTHTFGTVATGGFSTRNLSVGAFQNPAAEIVIIIFMVIAGANFGLYYFLLQGQWRKVFKDSELRFYIGLILLCTGLVVFNIGQAFPSYFDGLRTSAFQVVSIMTTTGFGTANFDAWPEFSRLMMLLLMFLGGCAGSTGGAMKQIRILILFKYAYRELRQMLQPKAVIPIRVGEKTVPDSVAKNILGFVIIYIAIFIVSSLFMTLLGLDLTTAISSVAATIGNIGPGLGQVGPVCNYSEIPQIGKLYLSILMLLGRLELFTVVLCFIPEFWQNVRFTVSSQTMSME